MGPRFLAIQIVHYIVHYTALHSALHQKVGPRFLTWRFLNARDQLYFRSTCPPTAPLGYGANRSYLTLEHFARKATAALFVFTCKSSSRISPILFMSFERSSGVAARAWTCSAQRRHRLHIK